MPALSQTSTILCMVDSDGSSVVGTLTTYLSVPSTRRTSVFVPPMSTPTLRIFSSGVFGNDTSPHHPPIWKRIVGAVIERLRIIDSLSEARITPPCLAIVQQLCRQRSEYPNTFVFYNQAFTGLEDGGISVSTDATLRTASCNHLCQAVLLKLCAHTM